MSMPRSALSRIDERSPAVEEFAHDVCAGLTKPGQKELHSKYLYDNLGSTLFEAITFLPEYGLTRADERLLSEHAEEIAGFASGPISVVELGSGSGRKMRDLLEAIGLRQRELRYYPIDVSEEALTRCERELAEFAQILPMRHSYLSGLERATSARRPGETLLVLFVGSTVGNFERPCAMDFLKGVRRRLAPGDALLV
jgi:L-histidine N-alpha-methyltransferase